MGGGPYDDGLGASWVRARSHRGRRLAAAMLLAVLVFTLGFIGVGAYTYATNTEAATGCDGRPFQGSTPADFVVWRDMVPQKLDTGPYHFTDYRDVAFPTRGGSLTIRGWYAPGRAGIATPTVILVHGKDSCRSDGNVLLPAGMLHRAGFGVLLIDLRNHGTSDVTTGHWAAGSTEYADVLGAWDWLVSRGHAPARIGLFGASMGAASATIATGEELRVAATWADSSFADPEAVLAENAVAMGFPGVEVATTVIGRAISEPAFATKSPAEAARRLDGRPFFIVQGMADETVLPHHAVDLAAAAHEGGTDVEPWIVPGSRHTEEMIDQPQRYEAALLAFFTGSIGKP